MSPPPRNVDVPGGRGPFAVQAIWVLVALSALAITAASVPVDFGRYVTLCTSTPGDCLARSQLTPEGLRELERVGISLGLYAALRVGISTLASLVWFTVGGLVFLLRPRDRMALLVSTFLIVFGTATLVGESIDVLVSAHPALWIPARGLQVSGEVLAVLFFLTFPDGSFVPRWIPLLGALFLFFQVPGDVFPELYRSAASWLGTLQALMFLVCVLGMIAAQVYRYRVVSTFEQRRQTRWIVFGTTLAISFMLVTLVPLFFILHVSETTYFVALLIAAVVPFVMLLIPISVGIATVRSGLFDIDRVINRALVYGTLTVSLVVMYLGAVVGTQRLLSPLLGEGNQLAVVVSTLVIAALFQPLRWRIQAFIDRRFYRSKYDAARLLERFGSRLREETDLDSLTGEVLGVVRETMQPEHASLWLHPHAADAEDDVPV